MSRDYTKLVAEWEVITRYREHLAAGGAEGLRRWLTETKSEHRYERLAPKNTECMKADNAVIFANEKIARYKQFLPKNTIVVPVAAPPPAPPREDTRLLDAQKQIFQLRQQLAAANLRIDQFTMLGGGSKYIEEFDDSESTTSSSSSSTSSESSALYESSLSDYTVESLSGSEESEESL